jgi:hypothetical protein
MHAYIATKMMTLMAACIILAGRQPLVATTVHSQPLQDSKFE